jgi:cytochrome b561
MFVLLLMIVRLIIRLRSAHPAPATIGSSLLDRMATMAHRGLYLIVFLMIATGWTTGFLIRGAFGPHGRLPKTFDVLPTFQAHAALACLLVILIAAHIGAALYHQFVRKDGLIGRMWFGKRAVVRGAG